VDRLATFLMRRLDLAERFAGGNVCARFPARNVLTKNQGEGVMNSSIDHAPADAGDRGSGGSWLRKFVRWSSVRDAALAAVGALLVSAAPNAASATVCGTTTWTLWAGQTKDVGTLTVSNDADNIYVTYTLTEPGATLGAVHLWLGNDLTNLPKAGNGAPIPGQFPYKIDPLPSGTTTYAFTIPFTDLNIQDVTTACGLEIYVVAHAEVNYSSGGGDTAFGGDNPVNVVEPGRWWYYGKYKICCPQPDPPDIGQCKTAFAKGGWVFVTDAKANPEGLPSLKLIKQRWGWAIKLGASGNYGYDIWAGAGLNKTANGVKVGRLLVDWDGSVATVTYNMFPVPGYVIKEVHVYAADSKPTTTAPGQYGYTHYFDPPVSTHSADLSLVDGDGLYGVWLIAHAVVCAPN
jgi:hypothetical protein